MKYNENIEKYDNLWELFAASVEKNKNANLLNYIRNYAKVTSDYNEFYNDVKKLAAYLDSIGIKKADKAVIFLPSKPEWLQIMFAAALLGIILVPIDMETKPEPIAQILKETQPKIIFESKNKLIDSDYAFPNVLFVENIEEKIYDIEPITVRNFAKEIDPDDVFEILYTSGTTGTPKGVIITNKMLTTNIYNALLVFPLKFEIKALQILPFSHSFALILTIGIIAIGGSISFVKDLSAEEIKKGLNENEVHLIAAVPLFLNKIKDGIELKFKKAHLLGFFKMLNKAASLIPSMEVRRKIFFFIHKQLGGNVRLMISGGSYLHPDTYKWWEGIGVTIIKGYGATETGPILTLDRIADRDAYSIGYPLPNQQLQIIDNEILAKGDHVTPGYFNNLEKTKEVFSEDGWYKTGDLGFKKGEKIFYQGRGKDMIVLQNGMNVYPEDIENIFNSIPEIMDTAIVGIDKGEGEEVFGVFSTKLSKEELSEIIEKVNKNSLNPNQWVKDFYIWPEEDLPRTHTKKVKKPVVREKVYAYLKGEQDAQKEIANNIETPKDASKEIEILRNILADVTNKEPSQISYETNLVSDLSMDSLCRADLLTQIEKELNKTIVETTITPETSFADLIEIVNDTPEGKSIKKHKKLSVWATKFPATFFRNIFAMLLWRIVLFFFIKVRVNGKIPKDQKQFLIISNHRSNLDGVLVSMLLPSWLRNNTYITASGFHWDETWRKYFKVFIELFILPTYTLHGKNGIDTMEKTAFYINQGYSLLIFPEGRLIYNKNKQNKFKKGAAKIVKEFRLPILEFKIKGLEVIKPHMLLPAIGFNKVVVDIEYKELNPHLDIEEINEILQNDFQGY